MSCAVWGRESCVVCRVRAWELLMLVCRWWDGSSPAWLSPAPGAVSMNSTALTSKCCQWLLSNSSPFAMPRLPRSALVSLAVFALARRGHLPPYVNIWDCWVDIWQYFVPQEQFIKILKFAPYLGPLHMGVKCLMSLLVVIILRPFSVKIWASYSWGFQSNYKGSAEYQNLKKSIKNISNLPKKLK